MIDPSQEAYRQQRWFINKRYGYGWTPATWQGWLILITFVVATLKNALFLTINPDSTSGVAIFLVIELLLTTLFYWACLKTGDKPQWRWGK